MSSVGSNLQKLLREYYRTSSEFLLPEDFILREFAFQTLSGAFVRHLSFQNVAEFREFLVKETPKNSYYSVALYSDPAAQKIEDKGYIFAELFFDIDVDHLPECNTVEYQLVPEASLSVVSEGCVEVGKQEQLKLLDILTYFFGFSMGEIRMYFTGHRGFHTLVRPRDEDWMKLTSRQRRELVDFIKLRKAEKVVGKGRKARSLKLTALYARALKLLETDPTMGFDEALNSVKVEIDELVTPDLTKLARVVNTLNGKTGFKVTLLHSESELVSFTITPHLSPFRKEVEVRPLFSSKGEVRILDYALRLVKGRNVVVPGWVAVYLALNGVVEVV
ncbi:MAG: hypothetical protein LM561_06235 [Desulfurococcaceae archaeon]|nr:hypothetical protein [Desulfurococcaceae archaeon]